MYKGPLMDGFQTLNATQVKARKNIYATRAKADKVSDAVRRGTDVWEWAYSLFGHEKFVRTETVTTIHHEQEEAVAP